MRTLRGCVGSLSLRGFVVIYYCIFVIKLTAGLYVNVPCIFNVDELDDEFDYELDDEFDDELDDENFFSKSEKKSSVKIFSTLHILVLVIRQNIFNPTHISVGSMKIYLKETRTINPSIKHRQSFDCRFIKSHNHLIAGSEKGIIT